MEVGLDGDLELLELINSGRLSESKIGKFLHSLKTRFSGEVVADLLCYLRIRVELSLRAKGILMMREGGFDVGPDDETRALFAELRYLEGSIGTVGKLTISPFLHFSGRELWQLYMLGKYFPSQGGSPEPPLEFPNLNVNEKYSREAAALQSLGLGGRLFAAQP